MPIVVASVGPWQWELLRAKGLQSYAAAKQGGKGLLAKERPACLATGEGRTRLPLGGRLPRQNTRFAARQLRQHNAAQHQRATGELAGGK